MGAVLPGGSFHCEVSTGKRVGSQSRRWMPHLSLCSALRPSQTPAWVRGREISAWAGPAKAALTTLITSKAPLELCDHYGDPSCLGTVRTEGQSRTSWLSPGLAQAGPWNRDNHEAGTATGPVAGAQSGLHEFASSWRWPCTAAPGPIPAPFVVPETRD